MTSGGGAIGWGAKIDEHAKDQRVRQWTVELQSEPLGSLVVDTFLDRFAAEARRLAPNAECSLGLGRFRMRVTIDALTPDEAADTAEEFFKRALETALWPHSALATFTHHEVLVEAKQRPSAA
jgi:hypothetical protein